MSFTHDKREQLLVKEHFILTHGGSINDVVKRLNVSKQTAYNYLKTLIDNGCLKKEAGKYKTVGAQQYEKKVILAGLDESDVYMEWARNKITVPKNVEQICQHGFTEILNNAIDHSGSKEAIIFITNDFSSIKIIIADAGIGIFEKIRKEKGLSMLHHAIIELDKGKVTTDSVRHSGEGIFFTSKMFDQFMILANGLIYRAKSEYDYQFLNKDKELENLSGTEVFMDICKASAKTVKEIFDQYALDNNDFQFCKTVVPVIHLLDRRNEDTMSLVSRSQAKRLLNGFEKFKVVMLDFSGIESIGQAFADEIFRVYPNLHKDVAITYENANAQVEHMIKHVMR